MAKASQYNYSLQLTTHTIHLWLAYLSTFTLKINQMSVKKTSPMDGPWAITSFSGSPLPKANSAGNSTTLARILQLVEEYRHVGGVLHAWCLFFSSDSSEFKYIVHRLSSCSIIFPIVNLKKRY